MSALPPKIKARLSTRAIFAIVLLIIFGIALALRISLAYENVFTGDWVRFLGVDPWHHMRLVDNLVHNFPHRILFDPYALYPNGQVVGVAPFFDMLLGFLIWVIGLGSPSQHTIDTVGAYFPAILGALVTVPVYFIGKELFNRNVGLLSAALIAILPGQFLYRSLLGFTDHHVAEVLFSTTAALFLIMAIKRAKQKEISFSHIRRREWGNLKKPLIYALLAGLALGLYLLSWIGGLLFVFIIFAYMIIQYIIDHLMGKSTDYLCIIALPMFLIALIMVVPFSNLPFYGGMVNVSLATAVLTPLVLSGVSRLVAHRNMRRFYYPLALACMGLAAVGVFYAIDPSLFDSMVGSFGIFTPGAAAETLAEVRPLLSIPGLFLLLYYFTADIVLAIIALCLIIYAQVKMWNSEKTLLIIWCLIMLAAMLGQSRFAYYFAVNVALLAAYLCWRILEWSWTYFREAQPEGKKNSKELDHLKKPNSFIRGQFSTRYVRVAGVAVIVFLIAFVPNIAAAIDITRELDAPTDAWYSSLSWMKLNDSTQEPFGDPDFYYELYEKPLPGESYNYSESAYGVISLSDYGYWITRIARRIPNANPSQLGAQYISRFFTAQDESSANEVLDNLGSRYVIIDYEMDTARFGAMAIWAGKSESQFGEEYYVETEAGGIKFVTLLYPDYYRSMCSRLYNFGGEVVVPQNSTVVISYREKIVFGERFKEITSSQTFATYTEAKEYLENQTAPNYRMVGLDPFTSPVPLEELEHYKLVHQSEPQVVNGKGEPISLVKIFEYEP